MKSFHDWFEFEAMLYLQWEEESYNDVVSCMRNNGESPSDFLIIEYNDDYDWVPEFNDRNEYDIFRKTIIEFYVFTKDYCYTFNYGDRDEQHCVVAPRNPINELHFGIRRPTDDDDLLNETEVEKHIARLNAEALIMNENSDYVPYEEEN